MEISFEKLIKGSVIIFVSVIVMRGLGFFKSILFARILDPTDLGIYGIVFNIYQIMTSIAVFGIPSAITKYTAEHVETGRKEKKIFFTGLILILILSGIISLIYILLSPLTAAYLYKNTEISDYMILSAIAILFASFNSFTYSYFQGIHKMKEISLLNISNSIIFLITSFIFLYFCGLIGAFYAIILTAILTSIFGIVLLKQKTSIIKFEFCFEKETAKKLLNFGFPILLSSITILPINLLSRTLLAVGYGYDQVGYLQVALAVQTMILFIPSAISTNIFPWFSLNSSENNRYYLRKKIPQLTRIFIFLIGIIMILFIPISGYFVTILYGSRYFASIELIQWLLLETLFISQIQVYNSYAMSISKNYLILKLDILSLLLTVPLLYILVDRYGTLGVVWTSILVRAVVLLLFQKIVSKELGYDILEGLSTYGFTAISVFVLLSIYDTSRIQFVYMFIVLILYILIYIKNIFKDEDLRIIQKMLHVFMSAVPHKFSSMTRRRA